MDFERHKSDRRREFGHLELGIMEILWKQGESNVREVAEQLDRPLAYTTVMRPWTGFLKKACSLDANRNGRFCMRLFSHGRNGSASKPANGWRAF